MWPILENPWNPWRLGWRVYPRCRSPRGAYGDTCCLLSAWHTTLATVKVVLSVTHSNTHREQQRHCWRRQEPCLSFWASAVHAACAICCDTAACTTAFCFGVLRVWLCCCAVRIAVAAVLGIQQAGNEPLPQTHGGPPQGRSCSESSRCCSSQCGTGGKSGCCCSCC